MDLCFIFERTRIHAFTPEQLRHVHVQREEHSPSQSCALEHPPACAQVYKQLLEDYIGSAHYTIPFRIYACECWKDSSEVICSHTHSIPAC